MKRRASTLAICSVVLAAIAVMSGCGGCREAEPPPAEPVAPVGELTEDPPADVTMRRLDRIGTAAQDFIMDRGQLPLSVDINALIEEIEEYGNDLNPVDGWGRDIEFELVEGLIRVRSLGADGARDTTGPVGEVADPAADIIWYDGVFEQWPAGSLGDFYSDE